MRFFLPAVSLVFILLSTAGSRAETEPLQRFLDRNVAGFMVGADHEARLLSLYGEGTKYEFSEEGKARLEGYFTRCYFLKSEKTFLVGTVNRQLRRIAAMEISYEHAGSCGEIPGSKLPLETGKGIKLGMKLKEVLEVYGKPHEMSIEALTPEEIILFSRQKSVPEGMTPEEFASEYTKKRIIPEELGENDFLIAFGKPEEVLGFHKTAIYEYHTDHYKDPGVTGYYNAYLHFLKGKLVKIIISGGK